MEKIIRARIFILGIITIFLIVYAPVIFTRTRIFSHDTIWFYGIFQYFSESLLNGVFPLWDPYNYSGQPFYPNLSIMHLINPLTIIIVFTNKILNLSLLTLYHCNYMFLIIFSGVGAYLFFYEAYKDKLAAIFMFFIFIFSSFTPICLRQAGFLYTFLWVPWIMFFIIRLLKDINLFNSIGAGFFIGMAMGGYQGLFVLVFIAVFKLSLFINQRDFFRAALKMKNFKYYAVIAGTVICLSLPLLSVFIDKDDYLPMARMRTSENPTESFTNKTGCVPGVINDFMGLVNKDLALKGYFTKKIPLSEGFLHIGLIALALAAVGIGFGKNKYKINFIITLIFLVLIYLGDKTWAQGIVNRIFPPFTFVRHMQLFAGFILFNIIYFSGLGFMYVAERFKNIKYVLMFLAGLELIIYTAQALPYVTIPRRPMMFSEYPEKIKFPDYREDRIASAEEIRYFKPLLYRKFTAFNSASLLPDYSELNLNKNIYQMYKAFNLDGSAGYAEIAAVKNVTDFIAFGAANYARFEKNQKLMFLDFLNIVSLDFIRNKDFYFLPAGNRERIMALRKFINDEYKNIKMKLQGPGAEKVGELIKPILNLEGLDVKAGPERFVFMGKLVDIKNRILVHLRFYKSISASDFVGYVWGTSHVEEFTLLINKEYVDIMGYPYKNVAYITGITSPMIRFFPSATSISPENFKKTLKSEDFPKDVLFITDEKFKDSNAPILNASPSFKCNVMLYDGNDLKLECETSNAGYLFLADGYNKYWECYIDGKKTDIFKAYLVFKAVEIGAGYHMVKFVYKPRPFIYAIWLYYMAVIFCVIYFLYSARKAYLLRLH